MVNSAKLYDYYVNGFKDSSSTHTACVHLSKVTPASSTLAIYSAPSLVDLLNTDSIKPQEPQDIEAMEELWFNNPDPYDLAEIDCLDPDLQATVVWSSTWFEITNYVKLDDGKLTALISNVDKAGLGASFTKTTLIQAQPVGKSGNWNVASFLGAV